MRTSALSLKGIHYNSSALYRFCTWAKLGSNYNQRYLLAAQQIPTGSKVLDICAGTGELQRFLPESCQYTALEASQRFCRLLEGKGIRTICCNLHNGWPDLDGHASFDVAVMIISLAQFRKTTASHLLEYLKKKCHKVVVVEDILSARREKSLYQRAVNYLCATDYYVPVSWYTAQEFSQLMVRHGYQCKQATDRYWIGTHGTN